MAVRWAAPLAILRLWMILYLYSLLSKVHAVKQVKATVLIISRDIDSARSAHSGLQGYAIPYRVLVVPQAGAALPRLNITTSTGNFGGIVILGDVSYDYGGGQFHSALSDSQWDELFEYQRRFNVRMIRLDVYPGPKFGTTTAIDKTGCCSANVDQLISITNDTAFPTASIKTYAGVGTSGLWHYPATITEPTTTWEVAAFEPAEVFQQRTTAAVINSKDGREQMVFFMGWGTDWSQSSTFLQHAWINWMTRGVYTGFRRIYLNTQIDDMFLVTDLYEPPGSTFRIRPADLEQHILWMKDINRRLPRGSNYVLEVGHNGNGDIEAAVALNTQGVCNPIEAIEYPDQVDTVLEFVKLSGTGNDVWPAAPQIYRWSTACAMLDPLMTWWRNPVKRDAFMHVSHTFTHEALNNATYADTSKEVSFNRVWLQQSGISSASKYSSNGLIPPAITGLHNRDAIKAWADNGIKYVVGDNTRSILMNQQNPFWPQISTVAVNGYAGMIIIPRWATTVYYNCDQPDCTLHEWINTSGGSGDFQHLLDDARSVNSRHLLGLHWDPYMFHQANLRVADVAPSSINGIDLQLSLIEIWTEIVTQEMVRLTDWPIITKKHDDIAQEFMDRMARDQCSPQLTWIYTKDDTGITAVTLQTATGNKCKVPIPVSMPVKPRNVPAGTRIEQIGSDPITVWIQMNGYPVTLFLETPVLL